MKVFDVDKFLTDNAITIKLNGKDFTISDIDDEALAGLSKISEKEGSLRIAVAEIIGCSIEDLTKYGVVALNAIMKNITEALLPQPSAASPSED